MPHQPRILVSQIIPGSTEDVWETIREFDSIDQWHPVIADATIDGDESPVAIGSVRDFTAGDRTVRERLVAHSDVDRYYQYTMEGDGGDLVDYLAEVSLEPITETDQTLAKWTAHFDVVEDGDIEEETDHLYNVFSGGLNELRDQYE